MSSSGSRRNQGGDGFVPPSPVVKNESTSQSSTTSSSSSSSSSAPPSTPKPTFLPKAPIRRRAAPVKEAEIDIAAGPQLRQQKARPQREVKQTHQAPTKVAFQAPARAMGGRKAVAAGTMIGGKMEDKSLDAHEWNIDDLEKQDAEVSAFPPVQLPFPLDPAAEPWHDGWTGPQPHGLPAYRDPSLPIVAKQLEQGIRDIALIESSPEGSPSASPRADGALLPTMKQEVVTSTALFEAPKGSGGLLPFQSALNYFYPPKEYALADDADVSAPEFIFFQLPSHLPVGPAVDKSEEAKKKNAEPPSTEESLMHDLPMTVDDSAVKNHESTSSLSKQYKIFSSHDSNAIKNVEAGRIGELVVYKSGKVKLRIGETLYDVSQGVEIHHRQDLVSIGKNHKDAWELHQLGTVQKSVVCALDIDDVLKRKKEEDSILRVSTASAVETVKQ